MAILVADARERNGAIPHLDACIAENNKYYEKLAIAQGGGEIKFLEDTIHVGDYAILLEEPAANGTIRRRTTMVFERKTWKDLASSIKDGRSKSQHKALEELREKTGCLVWYIIEGNFSYSDKTQIQHIPFQNLHAKIRHNMIRGIPFVQTRDEKDTAKLLVKLTRDVMRLHRTGQFKFGNTSGESTVQPIQVEAGAKREMLNEYIAEIRKINQQYRVAFANVGLQPDLLNEIDHIVAPYQEILPVKGGVEEAIKAAESEIDQLPDGEEVDIEALVNIKLTKGEGDLISVPAELKTKKIMADCDILEKMWMALPTVTDKSAPILMQKYSLSDILCAKPTQINFLQEAISEMKFNSGMKLGDARAKKILAIAYVGDDPIKKEHVKNLSAEVLAQVPGVTKPTAMAVLDQFTLRAICSGEVNPDDIANIKRGKNRSIGAKLAEKICSLLTASATIA